MTILRLWPLVEARQAKPGWQAARQSKQRPFERVGDVVRDAYMGREQHAHVMTV